MTTIGLLGGGQLGRMLGQAGLPLGIRCRFLDPSADAVATAIGELVTANYDDAQAQKRFAEGCDALSFEFENVSLQAVQALSELAPMYPPAAALAAKQDRLDEKRFFNGLGIKTAPFVPVNANAALQIALQTIGLPAVLKTRRDGYDGKGQQVLRADEDAQPAWDQLGGVPLILEGFIAFERELSLLSVRSRDGEIRYWPLVENQHRGGILHRSIAPAPASAELQPAAEAAAKQVLEALDYVGVLAIEFFEHEGGLIANEFAPRVHNSGHWTIEGAVTSQFANHLRAVAGLPLGDTKARGHSVMINLIGAMPDRRAVLSIPGTQLHDYGKAERPGRKLGHVTITGDEPGAVLKTASAVEALIGR